MGTGGEGAVVTGRDDDLDVAGSWWGIDRRSENLSAGSESAKCLHSLAVSDVPSHFGRNCCRLSVIPATFKVAGPTTPTRFMITDQPAPKTTPTMIIKSIRLYDHNPVDLESFHVEAKLFDKYVSLTALSARDLCSVTGPRDFIRCRGNTHPNSLHNREPHHPHRQLISSNIQLHCMRCATFVVDRLDPFILDILHSVAIYSTLDDEPCVDSWIRTTRCIRSGIHPRRRPI